MKRGEIWWVDLPEPRGSEPGYRRPVLIMQSDGFNRSRINTVVAIGITSNLQRAAAPGNVSLPAAASGLDRESVVNVSQIVTLDKAFLDEKAGRIPAAKLQQVEDGVRLVLGL